MDKRKHGSNFLQGVTQCWDEVHKRLLDSKEWQVAGCLDVALIQLDEIDKMAMVLDFVLLQQGWNIEKLREAIPRMHVILPLFREAPVFRNGEDCGSSPFATINVAMTLDTNYLRSTMATVFSMLQHSTCPENLAFHFLSAHDDAPELFSSINSTFFYLKMKIYRFDSNRVRNKISKSIRQALDQPLNYAKIYLADTIPEDVKRVIYLDSDLVVVDDIAKLYGVDMKSQGAVRGAVRKHTDRRCNPGNNNMLW
ncbi:putative galacturonosyltransferase-like 4 [Glycine max]|nr:putative galacturonosyltransferase-like 4 [Glycine max]